MAQQAAHLQPHSPACVPDLLRLRETFLVQPAEDTQPPKSTYAEFPRQACARYAHPLLLRPPLQHRGHFRRCAPASGKQARPDALGRSLRDLQALAVMCTGWRPLRTDLLRRPPLCRRRCHRCPTAPRLSTACFPAAPLYWLSWRSGWRS